MSVNVSRKYERKQILPFSEHGTETNENILLLCRVLLDVKLKKKPELIKQAIVCHFYIL